jgi:hypothetical protein
VLVVLLASLGSATAALATPTWLAPFEPLPGSSSFIVPAMNAGGEALFADRTDLPDGKQAFRVASRPPGGAVGPVTLFPPDGASSLSFVPAIALADDGHAIVAWVDGGGAFYALRSPAGTWGAPTALAGATNVTGVVAGIDGSGIATLGWAENTNPAAAGGFMGTNDATVKVVRISPGGSVSGSQVVLPTTTGSQVASITTLQVAATGPAFLSYSVGSIFFSTVTATFRDTPTPGPSRWSPVRSATRDARRSSSRWDPTSRCACASRISHSAAPATSAPVGTRSTRAWESRPTGR